MISGAMYSYGSRPSMDQLAHDVSCWNSETRLELQGFRKKNTGKASGTRISIHV